MDLLLDATFEEVRLLLDDGEVDHQKEIGEVRRQEIGEVDRLRETGEDHRIVSVDNLHPTADDLDRILAAEAAVVVVAAVVVAVEAAALTRLILVLAVLLKTVARVDLVPVPCHLPARQVHSIIKRIQRLTLSRKTNVQSLCLSSLCGQMNVTFVATFDARLV